jgi:hypothetical protein
MKLLLRLNKTWGIYDKSVATKNIEQFIANEITEYKIAQLMILFRYSKIAYVKEKIIISI